MAIYNDLVLSGGTVSLDILNGDSAYNTLVQDDAKLRISSGGYVETTTVLNDTTISNAGTAVSTFLSGGTMMLSSGGIANVVSVLCDARLTVVSGASATGVYVSGGNVDVVVNGGDTATRIEGTNERGSFFLSNGVASNFLLNSTGQLTVSSGGEGCGITVSGGGLLTVSEGGSATDIIQSLGGRINTTVRGGDVQTQVSGTHDSGTFLLSNGVATNFILYESAVQHVSNGGVALRTLVSGAAAHQYVSSGGVASLTSVCDNGSMTIYDGGIARDIVVSSGGSMIAAGGGISRATVRGELNVSGASLLSDVLIVSGGTLNMSADAEFRDLTAASGARVNLISGAVLAGSKLGIAKDTIYYSGSALGMIASNGKVLDLGAGGKAYDLAFGSGAAVIGATVASGERLTVSSGAVLKNATVASGGYLTIASGADTGERLYFDFSDPSGGVIEDRVNDLSLVSPDTMKCLVGLSDVGSYTVASDGIAGSVYCMPDELYENPVVASGGYTNAFSGRTYELDDAGQILTVSDFAIDTVCSSATPVDTSGTELNVIDRAAVWSDFEVMSSGAVCAATSNFYGDAWLKLEGTKLSGAQLYGVSDGVDFQGYINLLATSGAVIRNLAAGAGVGGYVGGVLLTIDDATLAGVGYAGGFGTVQEYAGTLIKAGTFKKAFYAGALANHIKTSQTSLVGSVELTVKGGTFEGNLYGASAVKSDEAIPIHTVDDVTISIEGGSTATDNENFCLFAGGYATGSAGAESDYIYSILGDVNLTVSGGSWGSARGGRGIFGGILAAGYVAVQVSGDVNITIEGGSMGNVYGGGWAQLGGTSIVGNVNISIEGGEIANVFGGGSHSISGGTTMAGNVTITVSGGDITGDIYARGHLDGDTVASAKVIFTDNADFSCGVYGYSYVGDTDPSTATLIFDGYLGTFSGAIGGFAEITLDGKTAMTLSTAKAYVSNIAWEFDFTDRADALAGTSFLTWSTADFAGDTVRVNFADATQAQGDWSIATATFDATTTFTLAINDVDITSVAYDTEISGGDWAGWGFTLDSGVLKFKQLA